MSAAMKKNEKVLAIVAGVVLGVALLWIYVVRPTVERWRAANERVATLEEQRDAARALLDRKDAVRAERAAIDRALQPPTAVSDDLVALGRDLGDDAIPGFLEHLRSLTDAAGFKPSSLRYLRAEAFETYAELRFELKARAPHKQIHEFLVRMTASDWFLRVQALSIQPRDDGNVEVDMSLIGLATQDALEPGEPSRGRRR